MEKNRKDRTKTDSLRNSSSKFQKDEREGSADRSEENFQVEEIEEESFPLSSSSKGTEIVEEEEEEVALDVVVDENTSEEGTKSSYSKVEGMGNDLEKVISDGTTKGKKHKEDEKEEGATSNDTSFTSEVETLEIL